MLGELKKLPGNSCEHLSNCEQKELAAEGQGAYEEITTSDRQLEFAVDANGSCKFTFEGYLNYNRTFRNKDVVTGPGFFLRYLSSYNYVGSNKAAKEFAACPSN